MKRRVATVGLLCLLAGCGFQQKRFEKAAKEWVGAHVNDPRSLRFRELTVVKRSTSYTLCGEFNVQDRRGGDVGWTRFVVAARSASIPTDSNSGIIETGENADIFRTVWVIGCKKTMESH